MAHATRRRPFGSGGVEPSPTAQPPGLIPSELPRAGCPVVPRPQNMEQWRAACKAAQGAPVKEYKARVLVPGMQAWRSGRFLTVVEAKRKRVGDIVGPLVGTYETRSKIIMELRFEGPEGAEWLLANLDDTIACLA